MVDGKEFEDFENSVMEKFLDGDEAILAMLRLQYQNSKVKDRKFTGTGFYTTFEVQKNVSKPELQKSFQFGDVVGQIKTVKNGIGFVLYIKKGVLHMLEGYTYGEEKWPDTLANYNLSYISGSFRDMEKLKIKINKQLNQI